MNLVEVRNVTVGYVPGIDILQDVSIDIEANAVTGVIGLNGAGKSTLMKTICGFLPPKKGQVIYDDQDLKDIPAHKMIQRGVWMIPQENGLFHQLTVEENITLPLRSIELAGRLSAEERLEETLEHFPELAEKRKSQSGDLSGGQQKILEIAKAFAINPKLLLIDEPSIGLSPRYADIAYSWIDRFVEQGTTAVLIDHHVQKVIGISSYVYVLGIGRVVDSGAPASFDKNLSELMQKWMGLELAQDA